jgi:SSS family solute:Na+ symporter
LESIDPGVRWLLGITMLVYVVFMYALGWIANRRIQTEEDFLVAGRRLPLSLAWLTLLATWFGAGTLLTAADEVRAEGLQAAALDPFGAGACLLLAGWLVAGPMWRMKLLTVPDFFGRKFGRSAEILSALILVPSYLGWIAAQFVALASVLELFFEMPMPAGLVVVAVVGTGYTCMGGMWSVTLTDAVQMILILFGLVVLGWTVLSELGQGNLWNGLQRIELETDPSQLHLIPHETLTAALGWLGVFLIGCLGNLPGQDLMQRVFASNSEKTARRACFLAGVVYLSLGCVPLMIALASPLLLPEYEGQSILPAMAQMLLHPALLVILLIALLSAILSTIDSAILSPASVISKNLLPQIPGVSAMTQSRVCVMGVAACSLGLAFKGEDAYALLEESYALTLVGLFVPLMIGLYSKPSDGRAALVSMLAGTAVWGWHLVMGWESLGGSWMEERGFEWPVSIAATLVALLAYFLMMPPWTIQWSRERAPTSTDG